MERPCTICGEPGGRIWSCNGDGRLHRHGGVHLHPSLYREGDVWPTRLCVNCYITDWLAWNPHLDANECPETL